MKGGKIIMENQERETREQAGWNIVSQHSGMVLEQLQLAGRFYAEGLVDKWFWSLSACRELINHDLEKDEVTSLDAEEKKIKQGMKYWYRLTSNKFDSYELPKRKESIKKERMRKRENEKKKEGMRKREDKKEKG